MQPTWILVANSSEAKLYRNMKRFGELEMLKQFSHPESRTKNSAMASDRAGHYQCRGAGSGSMVEATDPKQYEARRFAMELADALDGGRAGNEYARLVVVASPQFLGHLNAQLNAHVQKLIAAEVRKDYTQTPGPELLPLLRDQGAL